MRYDDVDLILLEMAKRREQSRQVGLSRAPLPVVPGLGATKELRSVRTYLATLHGDGPNEYPGMRAIDYAIELGKRLARLEQMLETVKEVVDDARYADG